MPGSIGVSVIANAATMSAMGMIEENDSESLDLMRFCNAVGSFHSDGGLHPLTLYYSRKSFVFQVLFVDFLKISYLFIIYSYMKPNKAHTFTICSFLDCFFNKIYIDFQVAFAV